MLHYAYEDNERTWSSLQSIQQALRGVDCDRAFAELNVDARVAFLTDCVVIYFPVGQIYVQIATFSFFGLEILYSERKTA